MYLTEWGFWQMATESEAARKAYEVEVTPREKRANQDFYEGDVRRTYIFGRSAKSPTHAALFLLLMKYLLTCVAAARKKSGD